MAQRVLVLSPHLDDAVFSIGGTIARLVREGNEVEVVTVYCATPDPAHVTPRLQKFADYTQRRKEDAAAVGSLGARHRWLEVTERVFRPPLPEGGARTFETPPSVEGFGMLEEVRDHVRRFLEEDPDALLCAPLGVGNHVDHAELAVACMTVAHELGAFDRVTFYEDPYAMGGPARSAHFVTSARPWGFWEAPGRWSIRATVMFRMMGWQRKGPPFESYLPEAIVDLPWTCTPRAIDGHEEAKRHAIGCYESQVKLFGGIDTFWSIVARYHTAWGNAEPFWTVLEP